MPRGIPNPPCTPHRPQGPRPPGAPRPRNSELSPSLRMRICEAKKLGLSYRAIRRHFSNDEHIGLLPLSTIKRTVLRNPGRVSRISKPRTGRPAKLTEREKDMFYKEARENPNRTMKSFHLELASHVGLSTFKRALRLRGIKKWKKLKRSLLLPEHAAARLKWARAQMHWTVEDWKCVRWSDECNIMRGEGQRTE